LLDELPDLSKSIFLVMAFVLVLRLRLAVVLLLQSCIRDQAQAVAKAVTRQSFVLTTATASGKSLCNANVFDFIVLVGVYPQVWWRAILPLERARGF
jgi:hypothetical protein